ncbi:ogr/Delta-like zinc finger family protein [Vibrio sp. DW001]|uniref:ogr/Delta-like zinc finger family protein n=1 Tax=Vibrio sp. DW001 TaxID=2912315 RepID=UPI0023B0DC87|nr:ogr/Delta-like zinc finger family protein [Vibrio sp. DW001]WED26434.1 ogr/Delta-like zinc finger family protein [Vibrio sp. DW001]
MYVTCPICYSKAHVISKQRQTAKQSEHLCQCSNLNCSSSFKVSLSLIGGINLPKKPEATC